MDVTHAACELFSQIMARKMNIDQGGGRIPVASELRNPSVPDLSGKDGEKYGLRIVGDWPTAPTFGRLSTRSRG